MKANRFHYFLTLLACVGMMAPAVTVASEAAPASEITDIALHDGGLLFGQVMDAQGSAQAGQKVGLVYGDRLVVETKTDDKGVFAAAGLRGGQYQVVTESGVSTIRAWAPNTAPPAAREGNLIVVGDEVIRGNMTDAPRWMIEWVRTHPWLTTISVLAAVAIPVAIIEGDDNS